MRQVDRYRIEAELDSGGFGTVYRARHTVIGRVVALKLLHPSREASLEVIERFLREARILSAITSPHVVQVIDAGMTAERQLFLAMELLEGESLAARIQRGGPMTMRDAIAITRQIGAGLAAAHAVGIVHRDLKPANVFLTRGADGGELAKVLDFGISKSRGRGDDSVITMTGAVLGTPHYMAPEQLHGARDVDGRADLYALTVCLYEMLSARLPYHATTLEGLISQRLTEPPTPLATHAPHLPIAMLAVIDRGLARDPDARFRSVAELDAALAALSAPVPATTPPQRFAQDAPSLAPRPYGAAAPVLSAATPRTPPPRAWSDAPSSTPTTDTSSPPVTGSSTLVVLLGGATLAILLLVGALAMVTTVLVMSRDTPGASSPAAPVAPVATPIQPAVGAPIEPAPGAPQQPLAAAPQQPAPEAPPPAALSSPPRGPTRVWVHSALGELDQDAIERLFARAAPRIDRCRRDVPDDVLIQLFVNRDGRLPIVQPDVNEPHGDDETARCVANALRAAGPLESDRSDGIVSVRAHLEPR